MEKPLKSQKVQRSKPFFYALDDKTKTPVDLKDAKVGQALVSVNDRGQEMPFVKAASVVTDKDKLFAKWKADKEANVEQV